jgi:hypothetical protein
MTEFTMKMTDVTIHASSTAYGDTSGVAILYN